MFLPNNRKIQVLSNKGKNKIGKRKMYRFYIHRICTYRDKLLFSSCERKSDFKFPPPIQQRNLFINFCAVSSLQQNSFKKYDKHFQRN